MSPSGRLSAFGMSPIALGVVCGTGAAFCWAAGFVAARHGIQVGLSPADLALHRFAWAGLVLLPLTLGGRTEGFGGIGWWRAILLTLAGGPPLAVISYSGFILVPLGHGGVIQPSAAALFGLLYASVVLHESLPRERLVGAAVIVIGLCVIGFEAVSTIGPHGLLGDFLFVAAGWCFATFAMLVKLWHVRPARATVIVSVVSLADIPIHWALFGFDRMIALGCGRTSCRRWRKACSPAPARSGCSPAPSFLLGAGRAAVFTALVPPFTLLIGAVFLGEMPTLTQLAGLAVVLIGFRMTQRG